MTQIATFRTAEIQNGKWTKVGEGPALDAEDRDQFGAGGAVVLQEESHHFLPVGGLKGADAGIEVATVDVASTCHPVRFVIR